MKKIKQYEVLPLDDEKFFELIAPYTEIVVVAPWYGQPVPVTIRMLDSVGIDSCGDFNTISKLIQDGEPHFDKETIIETKNIHERMLKLALVHPTFKVLEEHLITKDFYKQKRKEITEIENLIEKLTSEKEKHEFYEQLDIIELSIAFLMPEDFTSYIVAILMQQQATDINKLTRETLLRAGFLAEKYNVRPSEYLEGIFTKKQKTDIDTTALVLVDQYRRDQKTEKNGMHWIRGKGK
jgi:hypothetical protein